MANPVGVGIEFFTSFQSEGVNAARNSVFNLVDSMHTLNSASQGLSMAFTKMSRALIGGLGEAVKDMIELEKNFFNMARIIGDGGTSGAVRILEEDLISLSQVLPISSKMIANLGAETAQLGIATENVAGTIETSVKAAESLGINVESVVTKMGRIANLFEVKSENFEDFVNRFSSATVDLANTTVATGDNILEMTRKLASYRAITNASAQETIALSAVLASMGGETATSATAMSILFSEMQEQTSKYAEIAGTTEEAFLKLSASDRLEKFFAGMKKAADQGEGALAPIMKDLGIARSQVKRSVLNLMKAFTGGVDPAIQYRNVLDRANKSMSEGTALNDAFSKVMGTTENKLQITKNSMENLRIGAVQPFNAAFKPLLDMMNMFLHVLEMIPNSVKAVVVILGVLSAAIAALLTATGALAATLAAVGLAIFNLRRQFFDYSPAHFVKGMTDVYADFSNFLMARGFKTFDALGASATNMVKKQIMAAQHLQSGFVGVLQKGIAGAGVDISRLRDRAEESIRLELVKRFGQPTNPVQDAIMRQMAARRAARMENKNPFNLLTFGDFGTNIQALRLAVARFLPQIIMVGKYLVMWPVIIMSTVAALNSANGIIKAIGVTVLAMLAWFYPIAAVAVVILAFWNEITQVFGSFVKGVKSTSSLFGTVGGQLTGISNTLNKIIGDAGSKIFKGFMDLALFFGKFVGQMIDLVAPIFAWLVSTIAGRFAVIIDITVMALSAIGDVVQAIGEIFNLVQGFSEEDTGAGNLVSAFSLVGTVVGALSSGLYATWVVVKLLAGIATGLFEGLAEGIKNLKTELASINEFFNDMLPEGMLGDGTTLFEDLKMLATDAAAALKEIGRGVGYLLSYIVVPLSVVIKAVTTLLRLLGAVFGSFVKIKEFIFGSSFLHIAEGLKVIHKAVKKDLIAPLSGVQKVAASTKSSVNQMMGEMSNGNAALVGAVTQMVTTSENPERALPQLAAPITARVDAEALLAGISDNYGFPVAGTDSQFAGSVDKAIKESNEVRNTTMTIYLTLPDERILAEAVVDYTNEEIMRSGGELTFGRKLLGMRGR